QGLQALTRPARRAPFAATGGQHTWPARLLGAAILAGLALKTGLEGPWRGPLIHPPEWDIAVAPLAHLLGTAWGCVCAWVWLARWPMPQNV
ncbi:MAG TPA: hypothetical protein VFL86_27730, partial [Burkholderiaceae bacterium]|nr:hypothetical protein [Burkholderiaceae bacterium]